MTELEKIEYARGFLDKLANGINPLTDTPVPEEDIVNNVRLSRCFFYVSDILRQVIENGGVTPPVRQAKAGKRPFTLSPEARATLRVTSTPLTVSELAGYLNDTVDETTTARILPAAINAWLVDKGFLEIVALPNGKARKIPTPAGVELGLLTEERSGQYGTYTVVLFSASAQTFVYDHAEACAELYEQAKTARKEQKAAAKAASQAKPTAPAPNEAPVSTGFLNRPWTELHDERLKSLVAEGASMADMTFALKRTEDGVLTRMRELGLA